MTNKEIQNLIWEKYDREWSDYVDALIQNGITRWDAIHNIEFMKDFLKEMTNEKMD